MSFLDERDGTLFAGDALTSIGGLHVVSDPVWYFPLPKLATWDKGLALQSAKKLAALRPERIATGHGRFITNAAAGAGRSHRPRRTRLSPTPGRPLDRASSACDTR